MEETSKGGRRKQLLLYLRLWVCLASALQTALCLFSLSKGFFVGAHSMLQVWCYNNNYHNFYMYYIRSLAVTCFD